MFEDLLADGSSAERYRTAPLHDERLHYLQHCAEAGARQCALYTIAVRQMHLVKLLDLQAGDRVDITGIEAAVEQRSRPGGRRSSKSAGGDARRRFVGHAVRWLRFAGMFGEAPCPPRHAHTDEVAAFASWMRTERGWADEMVRSCCSTVDRFFDRLDGCGLLLESGRIDDIDSPVAYWRTCGHSRVTVNDCVQRLRAFFRFAERQGWCRPGLAGGILPPRFHAGKPLPHGLDRDEVMRLLATTQAGEFARNIRGIGFDAADAMAMHSRSQAQPHPGLWPTETGNDHRPGGQDDAPSARTRTQTTIRKQAESCYATTTIRAGRLRSGGRSRGRRLDVEAGPTGGSSPRGRPVGPGSRKPPGARIGGTVLAFHGM